MKSNATISDSDSDSDGEQQKTAKTIVRLIINLLFRLLRPLINNFNPALLVFYYCHNSEIWLSNSQLQQCQQPAC